MSDLQLEQVYDKQLPWEVAAASWSPKMDLLALVLANGGVALYRMSLERVWCREPAEGEARVTQVVWRPDGRVLAAGYSSGQVCHLHLESGESVFSDSVSASVTCLTWAESELAPPPANLQVDDDDDDEQVLPDLPPISTVYDAAQGGDELRHNRTAKQLSVMAVGSEDGEVCLLLLGVLLFARISCPPDWCAVTLSFSPTLSSLLVVCSRPDESADKDERSQFEVNTQVLSTWSRQLLSVLRPFERLTRCRHYMDRTIDTITEAWESVVLKIDSRLEKFRSSLPADSCLVAEFLELLLTGVPSAEMEHFLLGELTEKGVRQLAQSVEHSHATLAALLRRHLHAVCLAHAELLLHVQGLARLGAAAGGGGGTVGGPLGALDEAVVEDAWRQAGALLLLIGALQRVLSDSTRHLHTLLEWLGAAALRLSEEPVAAEAGGATTSDNVLTIVQFLSENLDASSGRVQLERVAAFLRPTDCSSDCAIPPSVWAEHAKRTADDWCRCLQPADGVSLPQQKQRLADAIGAVFQPLFHYGQTTVQRMASRLLPPASSRPAVLWCQSTFVTATATGTNTLCLTWCHGERHSVSVSLSGACRQLESCGPAAMMALVVHAGAAPSLVRVRVSPGAEQEPATTEQSECALPGYASGFIAVSHSRNLLATVFRGNRRIRIHDMAVEEPAQL